METMALEIVDFNGFLRGCQWKSWISVNGRLDSSSLTAGGIYDFWVLDFGEQVNTLHHGSTLQWFGVVVPSWSAKSQAFFWRFFVKKVFITLHMISLFLKTVFALAAAFAKIKWVQIRNWYSYFSSCPKWFFWKGCDVKRKTRLVEKFNVKI